MIKFEDNPFKNNKVTANNSKNKQNLGFWHWRSRSFIDEGQVYCGLLKGLVPRVVVAKYEGNTPRTKKVLIPVQGCGGQRQRHQDYNNTSTFFSKKSRAKNAFWSISQQLIGHLPLNFTSALVLASR
jgi:hypothetical protein